MVRTLLKNAMVVNVFTGETEKVNVLLEKDKIIGVGDYEDAEKVEDLSGKYLCPGLIDGHIHIESTMMTPAELGKAVLPHGTTAVVADPHEIANVCGTAGIDYMLEAGKNIPMTVYLMLPSCVPATGFDESGACLAAEDLDRYYRNPRVLGLAEMMNYPGVISGDPRVMQKIDAARRSGKIVDGHAPLLSGHDLDCYLSAGINSDHECSSFDEAVQRIRKGQWVMIRQGTAARNLEDLLDLFDSPWNRHCILVTDDKHPSDLIENGHIDGMIRMAAKKGKSVIDGIRMATIQTAQCFGLHFVGAVAPGYRADLLVLNSLEEMDIRDVYCGGKKVVDNKRTIDFEVPAVKEHLMKSVYNSFHVDQLTPEDFHIKERGRKGRVIRVLPGQLLTEAWITELFMDEKNGIDLQRDILKVAVIERHMHTGHKGLGFISGIGLKKGAIASSVSHDSHNIVVIGTNEADMACAANHVIFMGGGCAAAENNKVLSELPLPIAGLMSDGTVSEIAEKNLELERAICSLGVREGDAPLMTMMFMSLAVIPELKMTTKGLVDVNRQCLVPLFTEN